MRQERLKLREAPIENDAPAKSFSPWEKVAEGRMRDRMAIRTHTKKKSQKSDVSDGRR